ncbi:MAG TPA: hypothetical protein VFB13_16980 [Reyranella sp.]|nr:hypothetical protein [Reyranella sp.]
MLALACALCFAGPASAQPVEFRPDGGGFRVQFPGPFKAKAEQVSTRFGNTHGVTATLERADGAKFYAQYVDYPPAAAQEGAQRLFESLTVGRTVKGAVRTAQRFQLDGNPAQREIVDWHFATRPVIVALDVLRGLRLYSIFCIVDSGREDGPDVRGFIDSFALLPL